MPIFEDRAIAAIFRTGSLVGHVSYVPDMSQPQPLHPVRGAEFEKLSLSAD